MKKLNAVIFTLLAAEVFLVPVLLLYLLFTKIRRKG